MADWRGFSALGACCRLAISVINSTDTMGFNCMKRRRMPCWRGFSAMNFIIPDKPSVATNITDKAWAEGAQNMSFLYTHGTQSNSLIASLRCLSTKVRELRQNVLYSVILKNPNTYYRDHYSVFSVATPSFTRLTSWRCDAIVGVETGEEEVADCKNFIVVECIA